MADVGPDAGRFNLTMELYGIVQPMVFTKEIYQDTYGEDDPEELDLLQLVDKRAAERIAGVLQDLYGLETTLTTPRDQEGLDEQIGTEEDLAELRRIAAAVHGKTPDDYLEGRVPAGFQFNHLINHDDENGFYVPVDFMQSFVIEETSVGSAVALLAELHALEPVLEALFPGQMAASRSAGGDEAPELEGPVAVWHALRRFCRSAIALDMPFRFD